MKRKNKTCVSTYFVQRCYGGPEEGGWWYDAYEFVDSKTTNKIQANHMKSKILKSFGKQRDLNSVLCSGIYTVIIEKNVGDNTTKEIPYYD